MGVGVGQALEQAGRPVTIVTDVTNQCSFLAFWKGHKFSSLTMAQDGGPTGYEAFVTAIRIMSGQKPKVNTIFFPLPIITNDNIDDYYDPSMTVQSAEAHAVERAAFGSGRPKRKRIGQQSIAENQKLS